MRQAVAPPRAMSVGGQGLTAPPRISDARDRMVVSTKGICGFHGLGLRLLTTEFLRPTTWAISNLLWPLLSGQAEAAEKFTILRSPPSTKARTWSLHNANAALTSRS